MKRYFKITLVSVLILTTLSMYGCDAIYFDQEDNQKELQGQTIRIAALRGPLTYRQTATATYGLEYDLFTNFAKENDLKYTYKTYNTQEEVVEAVSRGEADIAMARLPSYYKNKYLINALSFEDSELAVFCPHKLKMSEAFSDDDYLNANDLNKFSKIYIRKNDNSLKLESLALRYSPGTKVEVLLTEPENLFRTSFLNKNSCAVVERLMGQHLLRQFPNFEYVVSFSQSFSVEWLAHPSQVALVRLLKAWFQAASRRDEIAQIHTRYETFHSVLSRSDVRHFIKNKKNILPQYKEMFFAAGKEFNLPWTFIAAVAYQESHWNHEARSHTGVLGIMQLTQQTADHLGVLDRTDPEQSITGGAQYLRFLIDMTPAHLHRLDRWSLALIAYNVGFAHLKDIQKLAEARGMNPYSWKHLKELLPLLEDPDYKEHFQYGNARGLEARSFVERSLAFYSLIAQ